MINLLGKRNGIGIIQDYNKALENENIHLHVYGKEYSRIGRKMGHITMLGSEVKNILSKAKNIEKKIIL
jgi:5-(carboxyamino)imidazole ribonucleotide synthase